jgi:hypothetical protein
MNQDDKKYYTRCTKDGWYLVLERCHSTAHNLFTIVSKYKDPIRIDNLDWYNIGEKVYYYNGELEEFNTLEEAIGYITMEII